MDTDNYSIKDDITVLIVEDNEGVGKLIAKALSGNGIKCKLVNSGSTAVLWVLENSKCLILMDYYLGDMHAPEIIQSMKTNGSTPPFIIMTGQGDEKLAVEMMKLGAKDFLLKEQGFLDLLPSTIERVLNQLEIQYKLDKTLSDLKESEGRYQKITEAMTDYIFTVYIEDGKPVRTVHEPGCLKITGYSADEFSSQPFLWIDMVPENHKEMVRNHFRNLLTEKNPIPLEHCIIRKDNTLRWVRNTPVLRFDNNKNLVSYDGIVQDITETKKAQELLEEKETQLKKIFEVLDRNIFICTDNYEIEYMNKKMYSETGVNSKKELCYKILQKKNLQCPWCNIDNNSNCLEDYIIHLPEKNKYYSINEFYTKDLMGQQKKHAIILDVTEQKKCTKISDKNKDFFSFLHNNEEIPLITTDYSGKITKISKKLLEYSTLFKTMSAGKNIKDLSKDFDDLFESSHSPASLLKVNLQDKEINFLLINHEEEKEMYIILLA